MTYDVLEASLSFMERNTGFPFIELRLAGATASAVDCSVDRLMVDGVNV